MKNRSSAAEGDHLVRGGFGELPEPDRRLLASTDDHGAFTP
jgi:hypothetical protein